MPAWDFRWQGIFSFKEPVKLPKGSTVEVVAHYDNTAANPDNPSRPPREVRWGEGTDDEMCVAALFYTVDAEHLTQGVAAAAIAPVPGGGGGHIAPPARRRRQRATSSASRAGCRRRCRRKMAMKMFDKNGDGKLDAEERAAAMKFIEQFKGRPLTPEEQAGPNRFLDRIGGKLEDQGRKEEKGTRSRGSGCFAQRKWHSRRPSKGVRRGYSAGLPHHAVRAF